LIRLFDAHDERRSTVELGLLGRVSQGSDAFFCGGGFSGDELL
jgi:hypothetical protein